MKTHVTVGVFFIGYSCSTDPQRSLVGASLAQFYPFLLVSGVIVTVCGSVIRQDAAKRRFQPLRGFCNGLLCRTKIDFKMLRDEILNN